MTTDDDTCPCCGNEITPTDTLVSTAGGSTHAECWAADVDALDDAAR